LINKLMNLFLKMERKEKELENDKKKSGGKA